MDVLEFYTDQLKGKEDNAFNMNSLNNSLTQVASTGRFTPPGSNNSSMSNLNGRPRDDYQKKPSFSSNSGSNPVMKQGLSPMPVNNIYDIFVIKINIYMYYIFNIIINN